MDEFSFIEYLEKRIPRSGRVPVGIGDDAAVLTVGKGKRLVVSTDVIVENVDFILGANKGDRHNYRVIMPVPFISPEKIGRKALAVNLSDIAAMGASPIAFVISIGKPSYMTTSWMKCFYNGLLALAKQYNVACVGGDFSRSKEFFASVTIIGEASPHQIVKRSGAKPGDWIGVSGKLGGSILRHHYDFKPRVCEGRFLAEKGLASSMIDISDGLVQDLTHILRDSKVGAVLDLDKIPVASDAYRDRSKNAKQTDPSEVALGRALSDGEDFELLFTVPPREKNALTREWKKRFPEVPLAWIGKIEGTGPVLRWRRNGKVVVGPKLSKKGFTHF